MRKYEVAALLPDLTVSFTQHVAPASPFFEECASAFARGTLIETVRGPVAIEDLVPGDYILTASGSVSVTWIGSTTYVPGHEDEATTLTHMTRITTDAFGMGHPPMDLLLGPAARMVVRHPRLEDLLGQNSVLAPVKDYADGDRFLEVTPMGTVQLFHLMVQRHTTIRIGGVDLETYHPGNTAGQSLGQNMRALYLTMFPNISALDDFGQVSMTRTTRDVVENLVGV
ncbi:MULTISPECIES: Hint domain-containing protein [Mameliella]|uniref:Hint domain-containing protein n=1 Tax=Mameliella TaxID=1434019 RepID=UPI000B53412E|nr:MULTISPECIES: Hint domain-containing protein [Mameliella]MCR9271536.1 Hint domain-containing protein [Paracoccaceae bacterium]OWV61011.1 type I secretion protein [Mameliella alba]